MVGATTSAAGVTGLVPQPSAGAANRYLRSDGTWQVPPDTNTWRGIQNSLTSTSTTESLAAAQDKVLKDLINGKVLQWHNLMENGNPLIIDASAFSRTSIPATAYEYLIICGAYLSRMQDCVSYTIPRALVAMQPYYTMIFRTVDDIIENSVRISFDTSVNVVYINSMESGPAPTRVGILVYYR